MVNRGIVEWLKKGESLGYSAEQLEGQLIRHGYNPQEVSEAVEFVKKGRGSSSGIPENLIPGSSEGSLQNVPLGVKVIAGWHFVWAAVGVGSGVTSILHSSIIASLPLIGPVLQGFMVVFAVVGIAFSLIRVLIGWALLKLKNWARILEVTLSILGMFTIILIPVSVIFLYILFRNDTKKAFGVMRK